jgi:hypothetical protein
MVLRPKPCECSATLSEHDDGTVNSTEYDDGAVHWMKGHSERMDDRRARSGRPCRNFQIGCS